MIKLEAVHGHTSMRARYFFFPEEKDVFQTAQELLHIDEKKAMFRLINAV